ncbi:MAG: TldD/PmbA family protein [Thermodesulfovibrionales bacterium]|nr:TldD/PmbA family protein [Thermodesulfovibrionales bacterium]
MINTEFAKFIIDKAITEGASEAELYFRSTKRLSVEVKDQKIETLESSLTFGYAIRVIKDRKIGFSYSNDLKIAEKVMLNALEASKYVEPDENLCLPLYETPTNVAVFDKKIDTITEKDALDAIMLMESAAFNVDKKIKKTRKVSGAFSTSNTYIFNSHGLIIDYPATACSAQIMAIAENGSDSQAGWYYSGSRILDDIDFKQTGEQAAKRALSLLQAKRINSIKGFALIDNSVVVDFLGILANSLSSESIQKGKSLFFNRIGQQVLSKKINIIDSGTINHKLGSRPCDDEGVSTQHKVLIENGFLKNLLYNTYTAKKDGVKSTGNAYRGGYNNPPSVGPTNLFIEPASNVTTYGLNELFKAIDRGIYVIETMGMHTTNPISGDFSVGVSGLWIEKGEPKHPIKEAMISGNLLELFTKIVMIGSDTRFYGNLGSPSLLIEDVDISG